MIYYSSYRDQIYECLGRSDSKTATKVMNSFNMAQNLISRFARWESLQDSLTVTTSGELYTYSKDEWDLSDLWRVYSMILKDDNRVWWDVTWITPLRWDTQVAPYIEQGGTGKPVNYTLYNNYFFFDKKFDASYYLDIKFQYTPGTIYDDNDEVDLIDVDPILIPLTTSYAWMMLEQAENAKMWFEVANKNAKSFGIDLNNQPNMETYTHSAKVGSRSGDAGRLPPDYKNNPFVSSVR